MMRTICCMFIGTLCTAPALAQVSPDQQRQAIFYSHYLQQCNLMYQIGLTAKSLLSSGKNPKDVSAYLIEKYAYGPNGEILRGSSTAESQISDIVAVVDADMQKGGSSSPSTNFVSQQFLLECQRDAQRLAEHDAQANP